MPRLSFRRRSLLQALAASAVTLPFARMLHAGPGAPAAKRLVLLMQHNGTQQHNFWPDANLSSPILGSLFTDPTTGNDNGLKAKTNLVKQVYVPYDANGTDANEHDMGFARMFTGERLAAVGGQPWGGGRSVDQILARAWGIDSLTLAVLASKLAPMAKPGFDHRESFCYLDAATIKHPRKDPLGVFNYLFQVKAAMAGHRVSVLDSVAANLAEVSSRLGPAERAKLDDHLTAIREVEQRLKSTAQCPAPTAPPDYLAMDPNSEVSVDTYVPQIIDDLIDLAALALKCGITRIATMQFGFCGASWAFEWKGINADCHLLAHKDTSDAGSTPENTARLVLVNQYFASCVARIATALDAVGEGNGTMLDNTLVVWANEFGRGDHSLENVPIALIGGAGGGMPTGGRVIDAGRQPFNRLGCTILNAMGMSVAGFGDIPDCGAFQGLR
jgi:uncharacterized protein DUF1552